MTDTGHPQKIPPDQAQPGDIVLIKGIALKITLVGEPLTDCEGRQTVHCVLVDQEGTERTMERGLHNSFNRSLQSF